MIQILLPSTASSLLNYVVSIALNLKWAWDYLLSQSLFQHCPYETMAPQYVFDDSNVTCYKDITVVSGEEECAVCLCKIDQDDEVRELRCGHLFHRVCLDRWLGYGHVTCPLCRNRLNAPPVTAELYQEVILINFCATSDGGDRERWWLR